MEEWWSFYWNNDKTILSTSSENMSGEFSDIIYFTEDKEQKGDLFVTSGFKWKHRKSKEVPFLKELSSSLL